MEQIILDHCKAFLRKLQKHILDYYVQVGVRRWGDF